MDRKAGSKPFAPVRHRTTAAGTKPPGCPVVTRKGKRVTALGGVIVHPDERWVICRDSEGTPFALAGPP